MNTTTQPPDAVPGAPTDGRVGPHSPPEIKMSVMTEGTTEGRSPLEGEGNVRVARGYDCRTPR